MEDKLEKIARLENEIEAGLLDVVLQEREIPHLIRSYHDAAYGVIFQLQKGWGAVFAPSEYENAVKEILDSIRNPPSENDDDMEGDPPPK